MIALDSAAAEHVNWYAKHFAREPEDVANAAIVYSLGVMRSNYNEADRESADDSGKGMEECVIDAIKRRKGKASGRRNKRA